MRRDPITVETTVSAPVEAAWDAYTSPDRIRQWNFASNDWHCPSARVDLREGGTFSSRMEAKDGSMGFDFEGTYRTIEPHRRIVYEFGEREATIDFVAEGGRTLVRVTFDPESANPVEMQRDGWQAILNQFAAHVDASER